MYLRLGRPPTQAIVASTSRPTELLRLNDTAVLDVGKRTDLLVIDANPLENIATRVRSTACT
jgi:imidazolonepropionase-like amidohydrolase